jgi:hypothetical protein
VTVASIVQYGIADAIQPQLDLDAGLIPQATSIDIPLQIRGVAKTGKSEVTITLFCVFDDQLLSFRPLIEKVSAGAVFEKTIDLRGLGVGTGRHHFSFYAVDSDGGVSSPITFQISITDRFLPLRRPTIAPRFRRAVALDIEPALLPLRFAYSTVANHNFRVWGQAPTGKIGITHFDEGFQTRFRLSGSTSELRVTGGSTFRSNGIVLTTHLTQVTDNVVLVAFKVQNDNEFDTSVDIGCSADLDVDGLNAASI